MAIFITLIIIMIWASTLLSITSIINPFTEELGNIQRYNVAYYGAIAWVERSELVLRNHVAWFEWSWWFINKNTYWASSDFKGDTIKWKYWQQLSLTWLNNWFFWKITNLSKWNTIPNAWEWDLDPNISSWNNYYKLTYAKSLQFAFYKDDSNKDKYYTWYTSLTDINPNEVDVSIRTPWKSTCRYNTNNTSTSCSAGSVNYLLNEDSKDLDGDGISDDIIVNRSIFGYTWDTQFTVFPSIDTSWSNVQNDDTAIREDNINYYTHGNHNNIVFDASTNDTNPNAWSNNAWSNNTSNVTGFNQSPTDAVSTWFNVLFNPNHTYNTKQINLKFSLVNFLKYDKDNIYPYLVLKLNAWKKLPDLNFNILWEWKAWEYDVKIRFKRPIFNSTAASDFTVLF